MTKKQMQTVVDAVNVQSDYYFEFLHDKDVDAEDKETYRKDLGDLCIFMQRAKEMGFDVENRCYPLERKVAILSKEVKND